MVYFHWYGDVRSAGYVDRVFWYVPTRAKDGAGTATARKW